MMGETSLTFIPLDDPIKKPFEEIIENGYDGSDVTKLKGKEKKLSNQENELPQYEFNCICFAHISILFLDLFLYLEH